MSNVPTHVDFSDTPDDQIIPEGVYVVEVAKATLGTSQSSGNPMMTVNFNVIEGERSGSKLVSFMSLQPQALFTLKGFLKALGVDTSGGVQLSTEEYVGQQLRVKVTVGKDNDGDKRNNIKKFLPLQEDDEEDLD